MKKKRGLTLVEVLISLGILTMVLTGLALLTISAARTFDLTQAQIDAGRNTC